MSQDEASGFACEATRKYRLHKPWPKQLEFLRLDCKEALYGGAAAGGKSDALLMAALQYVYVPGYSAILFRRTFQDLSLSGALISRSHEWLDGTDAHWNDTTKTWKFPSGATLAFGYLDSMMDHFRYQSAEFQFIGFDELTQFEEAKYLYLFSRLRNAKSVDVPLRMRAATNPGGLGHAWVKRRFVREATRHPGAIYIPAFIRDNPAVAIEDYVDSLGYLDEVTRERYLSGNWEIVDDNVLVYSSFDAARHVAEPPKVCPENYQDVVGGIDPGTRDPYAVGIWGRDWDGRWWGIAEMYVTGETSARLAPALKILQDEYAVRTWFVDKRRPSDITDLRSAGVRALPNLDVHGEDARATVRPMIGVVSDLMLHDKWRISPRMKHHVKELETYRYKELGDRNAGEVPIDLSNHAMDCMRYCICSVEEVPQLRQRVRSGRDQMPMERFHEEKHRPGEVVVVPTAKDWVFGREQRWFKDQLATRRRRA